MDIEAEGRKRALADLRELVSRARSERVRLKLAPKPPPEASPQAAPEAPPGADLMGKLAALAKGG